MIRKIGVAALILLAMGMLVVTALSEDVNAVGTKPLLTEYMPGVVLVFPSVGDTQAGYDPVSLPYRQAYVGIVNQDKTTVKSPKSDPVLDNFEEGANISHRNDYTADIWWSLLEEKEREWDQYYETPSEALKRVDNQDWENHRLDWYYGPKGSGI